MTLRRRALPLLLAGLAAACSGTSPTLQGAMDGISESLSSLLGTKSLPGRYVKEIYDVHEDDRTWAFRVEASDALGRTREAVRGLASADYGSWREAAIVTALLSSMSDQHPSALVRAECVDSLTRMAPWTFAAVPATERRTTEAEAMEAVQQIARAGRREQDDPGAAASLSRSLDQIAAFPFDSGAPFPAKVDLTLLGRSARDRLGTARGTLRALSGGALGAYDGDPRVRDALDRAFVATSASCIRLAAIAAATHDSSDIVRSAAVRDLASVRPDQCARVLGAVLLRDDAAAVRREAARALGSFPEAEAVPELLPGLADDRFEVRTSVVAALSAVTGQTFGDDRRAWARWWDERGAGGSDAAAPDETPPTGADGGATRR